MRIHPQIEPLVNLIMRICERRLPVEEFCSIHRYSDKHECTFDYKALGEKEISGNNPVVRAQKVAKI